MTDIEEIETIFEDAIYCKSNVLPNGNFSIKVYKTDDNIQVKVIAIEE